MPFGRAPDLEVDGTLIAGTLNILRFLGMKFGKNCIRYQPKQKESYGMR